MQNNLLEETQVIISKGWSARIRPPTQPWNRRLIFLLHGWTGDENIMWIFARKLPVNCYIIAPRGPLLCPDGGYAWAIPKKDKRPDIDTYLEHCHGLLERLVGWIPEIVPDIRLDAIGFSQGAAMAYSMCLAAKLGKVAPLAGYIPPGLEEKLVGLDLSNLKCFIAHNSDDNLVPIEESRRAVDLLSSRGAAVQYCENKGGHKVSTACFNALDAFLSD